MKIFLIAGVASLCAFSQPAQAATETLQSLLGGNILTDRGVTFSNFSFADNIRRPFPGDFIPDPVDVDVTISTTVTSATLTFSFDPEVSISGLDPTTGFEHLFDFFINFGVAVTGGSSRTLTGLTLWDGNLSASGAGAFAEVAFHDSLPIPANPLVGISEATVFGSQVIDISPLANLSSLSLFGWIQGETDGAGATSGLSTFALTFDLEGTPPVTPLPLPASLPLILAGMGGLAFLRRRKSV